MIRIPGYNKDDNPRCYPLCPQ